MPFCQGLLPQSHHLSARTYFRNNASLVCQGLFPEVIKQASGIIGLTFTPGNSMLIYTDESTKRNRSSVHMPTVSSFFLYLYTSVHSLICMLLLRDDCAYTKLSVCVCGRVNLYASAHSLICLLLLLPDGCALIGSRTSTAGRA